MRGDLAEQYFNINSLFDYDLLHNGHHDPLPRTLSALEYSRTAWIDIPSEVVSAYSRYRPTPLFRARAFELALKTNCEIYVKDESVSPTGNHKANSAYPVAALCRRDGIQTLLTETTGNWGLALAIAAAEFELNCICFLDAVSNERRPDTREAIEQAGATVVVVENDGWHGDLLTLTADAAIRAASEIDSCSYIFGSVYGYFVVPQSIMGIEAKQQLSDLDRTAGVVVGSCGGGANLLGIASIFIADRLLGNPRPRILSAESVNCPILSKGLWGIHSIDTQGYYPSLHTYGLDHLLGSEYIGGLGSTIVAAAAAHFHRAGIIQAVTIDAAEALAAAELFEATEKRRVALETAYQLAAAKREAEILDDEVILVNISKGANDRLFYESIAHSRSR